MLYRTVPCAVTPQLLSSAAVQRVRAKVLAGFEKTLAECDVILTPATASVAPALQQNAAGGCHLKPVASL